MEDKTVLIIAAIATLLLLFSSPLMSASREIREDEKCLKNHWGKHKILGRYSSGYTRGDGIYSGFKEASATGYKVKCLNCGRTQQVDDRSDYAFKLAHPSYKGEDVDGRLGLYKD